MASSVAVIDIGSNSIKLLILGEGSSQYPSIKHQETKEVRISNGIGQDRAKRLSEKEISDAINAVNELLNVAYTFQPEAIEVFATSAVRESENKEEFAAVIKSKTGFKLNILTGEQEAIGIAEGIKTDPTLPKYSKFALVDIGGGSMEYITHSGSMLGQVVSLPLGAVRLNEMCIGGTTYPFTDEMEEEVIKAVKKEWYKNQCKTPEGHFTLVGTGGACNVARAILAYQKRIQVEHFSNRIEIRDLRRLLRKIGGLTIADRQKIPMLPENRADIYPTALVALITVLDLLGVDHFVHSFHNLRYGLGATLLQKLIHAEN